MSIKKARKLRLADALVAGLANGTAFALVFGLAAALTAGFGRPRPPTRIQLRFHGTTRPFFRRFAASATVGLTVALVAHVPVPLAIGLGLVFGLTFAAQVWLDAPTDATERPTPGIALRQNRTAAFGFGLTLAIAFGFIGSMDVTQGTAQSLAAAGPLRLPAIVLIAAVTGGFVGYVAYGWIGCTMFALAEASVYALPGSTPGGIGSTPFHGLLPLHNGTVAVWFGIAYGLAVGVAGTISRAWGNFCLVRIWLALQGHLP